MNISNRGEKIGENYGSNFLWNLYMKTEVMSFTMSKNFTSFNDLKIGPVCLGKDEKVIMRIARFCSMNKGLTFDS